jgi:hypothetical protein
VTRAGLWRCRVCGAEATDYEPARSLPYVDAHNVIALPCGHEQPTDPTTGLRGLRFEPADHRPTGGATE